MTEVSSINDCNLELLIELCWVKMTQRWPKYNWMCRNIQCHQHCNQFKQFGRFWTKYNIFPMFYFLKLLQIGLCQYSASCPVICCEPIRPVGSSRVVYPPTEGQTDSDVGCLVSGSMERREYMDSPPTNFHLAHSHLNLYVYMYMSNWNGKS